LAEGVDAASLRNIAKDAETSIGMVYYYYTTKNDLFLAVVEETYQRILEDLEVSLRVEQSYRERMQALYSRIGSLSTRELEVVQLIVREALTSSERREHLVTRFLRGHLPLLLRAVLDGRESRELDPTISPLVAMACSMGIGAVPTVMLRLAAARWALMAEKDEVPAIMRTAVGELMKQIPDADTLAQSLSEITLRALGPVAPKRSG
jgi:AcrR family transcriptional regulator